MTAGEGSPTLPCSVIAASGTALTPADFNSVMRGLGTACSRIPRGNGSPPGAPLWIPPPEMDPFRRGQVR